MGKISEIAQEIEVEFEKQSQEIHYLLSELDKERHKRERFLQKLSELIKEEQENG